MINAWDFLGLWPGESDFGKDIPGLAGSLPGFANWLVGLGVAVQVSWDAFDKDYLARYTLLAAYKINNRSAILEMCKAAKVPSFEARSFYGQVQQKVFISHIGWISEWTLTLYGNTAAGNANLKLWRTEDCPCLVEVEVKMDAYDRSDFDKGKKFKVGPFTLSDKYFRLLKEYTPLGWDYDIYNWDYSTVSWSFSAEELK